MMGMAENSKIEWTHHTFNPWRGCTKVSAGCANCYAETLSGRNQKTLGVWGPNGTRVVASEAMWKEPLKWDRAAKAKGERHRVFCASLADVFEGPETMPPDSVPTVNEARARLFALIRDTPNLDWLLLTKRPQNFVTVLRAVLDTGKLRISETKRGPKHWNVVDWLHERNFLDNVWIGTSVEDQKAADERIPHLLKIPTKVRFLSMEPLLGPVDLRPKAPDTYAFLGQFYSTGTFDPTGMSPRADRVLNCFPKIDWVIVGGESGPGARPMHPVWAMEVRDQCQAAGVPFFFKQWGNWKPRREMTEAEHDDLHEERPEPTPQNPEPSRECFVKTVMFPPHPLPEGGPCDLLFNVGKQMAGRQLGGRVWDEFPARAEVPAS
jgi:protein gp37